MAQEIRPNYYKSAAEAYRPVLEQLGFKPAHLEMECKTAWAMLGFNYCAPLTHAVKYLWRCGLKDAERQDLTKARFWLNEGLIEVDRNHRLADAFHTQLMFLLPHPAAIQGAIALVDQQLEELENGPKI